MKPVTVYLLRHGQVDFPPGIYYGQMDVPLSEEGKRQSLLAARRMAMSGLDAVLCSDLERCTFMASLIQQEGGPGPESMSALREVNFGRWAGLSWDEIDKQYPGEMTRRMNDLEHYRPPGGESLSDLLLRVKKVFSRCISGDYGGKVAIVAHGGVNRVLLADFLEISLQKIFCLHQDHACINCVEYYPDGNGVLKFMNVTCHLEEGVCP